MDEDFAVGEYVVFVSRCELMQRCIDLEHAQKAAAIERSHGIGPVYVFQVIES